MVYCITVEDAGQESSLLAVLILLRQNFITNSCRKVTDYTITTLIYPLMHSAYFAVHKQVFRWFPEVHPQKQEELHVLRFEDFLDSVFLWFIYRHN